MWVDGIKVVVVIFQRGKASIGGEKDFDNWFGDRGNDGRWSIPRRQYASARDERISAAGVSLVAQTEEIWFIGRGCSVLERGSIVSVGPFEVVEPAIRDGRLQ